MVIVIIMGNMDEQDENNVTISSETNNVAIEKPLSHTEENNNSDRHGHRKHKKKKKKHKDKEEAGNDETMDTSSESNSYNKRETLEQDNKEVTKCIPSSTLQNTNLGQITTKDHELANGDTSKSMEVDDKPPKSDDEDDIGSGEDAKILEKEKKKLLKRRQSYKEEKHALKKKLEDTKLKVEEEVS